MTKFWTEIRPLVSCDRTVRGLNPLDLSVVIHVLRTGSQVVSQNDQRSYVSEGLRRSTTELRRNDLYQSRAGGIRTHDIRLLRTLLGPSSCTPLQAVRDKV